VNSELVGELDLGRLTGRVTDYAVELTRAERGYVILREPDGSLSVHTSRSRLGDEPHAEFSRSIAQSVLARGEPIVSTSAADDKRMKSFSSVHAMHLQSVAACRSSRLRHADRRLYVETRLRRAALRGGAAHAQRFADQVAIAIETARLVNENKRRADDLTVANRELTEARAHLKELLGDRTQKLKEARRKLRDAHDTLYSHFGYHGWSARAPRCGGSTRSSIASATRTSPCSSPARAARARRSWLGPPTRLSARQGQVPRRQLRRDPRAPARERALRSRARRVHRRRPGAQGPLREAEGGSVLLDEIGEMPHKMQAGLLRVLQERKVRPVGGAEEEPSTCGSSSRQPRSRRDGQGRELPRGSLLPHPRGRGEAPVLRERSEDVPQLVDHFLGIFAARYKREKGTLSRDAMRRLMAFDWPGNVRQLEHVLLNAWVLSDASELEAGDFDIPDGRSFTPRLEPQPTTDRRARSHADPIEPQPAPAKSSLSQHRQDEREKIVKALQACNWNRVKAAEMTGIPRRTFYRRLKDYGLQ